MTSLGAALCTGLDLSALGPLQHGSARKATAENGVGSGHFGRWIEDEHGLPAFAYTCNQTSDPHAVTDVYPGVLARTEHVHQIGNDRIIGLASNFGHVRVRQDEGGPRFLNDVDAENGQFGGGLGFLTDGEETLTTFYDGKKESFERIFGAGYFRKKVSGNRYSIDQIIYAPFGDDPVLLSRSAIVNRRDVPASLRWVEYWGCQPYEFSFRAFIEVFAGKSSPPAIRRQAARRYTHNIRRIGGGLFETRHFPGHSPEDEAVWQAVRKQLESQPNGFISPVHDLAPGTWFEDNDPPATFLVSLDGEPSGLSVDGPTFFGPSGPSSPAGLAKPLGESIYSGTPNALLLERDFTLKPGEERTLSFLYGYLPAGFEVDKLVSHFRPDSKKRFSFSSGQWKRSAIRFQVEGEPWVERETFWNYYYLRSSLTYDDFFQQHILNQNGFYQYVMGFQGAARDPLQHCLPFIFSDPEIVRNVLRYTLIWSDLVKADAGGG